MTNPGRLLASGRDADIYDHGPGLVLRRSRKGRSMVQEARTMDFVRRAGYPVPAVDSVSDDGTELVMERIDGLVMVDVLAKRPWTIHAQGRVLAALHQQLHRIAPPEWLREAPIQVPEPFDSAGSFLHLDLHPLNVMITDKGPVVIDWPNAALGHPLIDVALAWVLMACGGIPTGPVTARLMQPARGVLVKAFLAPFPVDQVRRVVPAVVEWKCRDPHMSDAEVAAMQRLAGSG